MEIINFSNVKFKDIPEQDNPAYDKHECLMLCEAANSKMILLAHIIPVNNTLKNDSLTRIGYFLNEEIAINVADRYAKNDQYNLDSINNMCVESLSPENFKEWEHIRNILMDTRENI